MLEPALSGATSRQIYLRLLGHVKPYWRIFLLAMLTTALTAATEPLFPALMKPLLDDGFAKGAEASDLYWLPLAIVGIFVLRGVFNYLSSYCFSWVSNRVVTDLRAQMFDHLLRLPASYFQSRPTSEPQTRIAYDVSGVAAAATTVLTTALREVLTIVGLMSWLLYLNWQLTLISLIMIPGVALVIRTFSGRLRNMGRAAQAGTAALNQVLQEAAQCQKVIKVFGGEAQEAARFRKVNEALRGYGMRQAIAAAASSPLVQLCTSIALAVVVYVALRQAEAEHTTVGGFVSFITAMLMVLPSLRHLADINAPLQRGLAAAESVFKLLDEPLEADSGRIDPGRVRGELQFRAVTFQYPNAETPALAQIDLDIPAGEVVALVGPSGGGKSTLVGLLPKFHRPTTGEIRIDGQPLDALTLDGVRRNIALVSQEILLFDDTLANNIAYGNARGASRDAIEAAARSAHALDFIHALPEGFETRIGEHGLRLSGGQRQRIAIARAILKDAPILILDEATSALDNESERAVQAALEALMQGRTTLVIAHRLSTIERADRIVVLAQGRIVEQGRHDELLARQGMYAHLHRLQFAEAAS